MFIQRLVPEASKACTLQPVSLSSLGLNELYAGPPAPGFWGVPGLAAQRCGPVSQPPRGSDHKGALRPPLSRERSSQPGGCFSLPLALSPPGLTSGSGARPPLSVLLRERRGPGRGAVNGGGGRRSGGRAQPRAPETLDSKPHNFPGSAAAPGA